jgi:hypothetical protein
MVLARQSRATDDKDRHPSHRDLDREFRVSDLKANDYEACCCLLAAERLSIAIRMVRAKATEFFRGLGRIALVPDGPNP